MRELLLKIRALWEGKAAADEAKKALSEVQQAASDIEAPADSAAEAVAKIGDAAAAPEVDTAEIELAKRAAGEAADAVKIIGETQAKPEVDASSIRAAARDAERLSGALGSASETPGGASRRVQPPPLPAPEVSAGENMLGDLAGRLAAAAAAGQAMRAAIALAKEFSEKLGEGTARAADLALQLETLPADKAAELRQELGPLAPIIEENRAQLAQMARDFAAAKAEVNGFWIEAGAQLAPGLSKIAAAAKEIDLSPMARQLGDSIGGAYVVAGDLLDLLGRINSTLNSATGGRAVETSMLSLKGAVSGLSPAVANLILAMDALAAKNSEAKERARELQEAEDAESAHFRQAAQERAAASDLALAKSAAIKDAQESLLSTEEKLASAKARQSGLDAAALSGDPKATAEAAANEALVVRLEAQRQKEEEISAAKDAALQKTREAYELQVALAEAVASGNGPEAERVRYAIDYAAALRAAGDTPEGQDLAKRMADAQAAKRLNDEEAKSASEREAARKKADAEKVAAAREQIALERERAQTRQAELKASGASEDELAKARLASADKIRELEMQIAEIQGNAAQVAALHAEQRKQDELEILAARKSDTETDPTTKTKSGDMFAGTDRRRGAITSDAFESGIDAGKSLLDEREAARGRPVGSKQGKSILGDDPSSSVADAAAPAKEAAQKMGEIARNLEQANGELKGATDSANDAASEVRSAASALKSALSSMQSEISALKRASSSS